MKQKFLLATLLAIAIKVLLIYIAIRASNREANAWQATKGVYVKESALGESHTYLSPEFRLKGIYRSMKGPVSALQFKIDSNLSELVWITGYAVNVVDVSGKKALSDDFICHNNLDFDLVEHHRRMNTPGRINEAYPRLITLTQGQTALKFPDGYGYPVYTNEPMTILTQVLNHNIPLPDLSVKHRVKIDFMHNGELGAKMKPLFERSIFVMLPFDEKKIGKEEIDPMSCVPVDPKNHRYVDSASRAYSGHWVIQPGRSTYTYNVTGMLNLHYDTKVHYIGVHTHPFAEKLELKDLDLDSVIFTSNCTNFENKIGLRSIDYYSSKEGLPVSKAHEYQLKVMVNNTSDENQDMMASMFLYFYDPILDSILNNRIESKNQL